MQLLYRLFLYTQTNSFSCILFKSEPIKVINEQHSIERFYP